MTPSHHGGSAARLSDADLEAMLARAAEEGARRALSDVGLGGKDAVLTIHDMRSLLECIQFVRRTAVQTAVHVITTGGADRAADRDRHEAAVVRAEPLSGALRRPSSAAFRPTGLSIGWFFAGLLTAHWRVHIPGRLLIGTGRWPR